MMGTSRGCEETQTESASCLDAHAPMAPPEPEPELEATAKGHRGAACRAPGQPRRRMRESINDMRAAVACGVSSLGRLPLGTHSDHTHRRRVLVLVVEERNQALAHALYGETAQDMEHQEKPNGAANCSFVLFRCFSFFVHHATSELSPRSGGFGT